MRPVRVHSVGAALITGIGISPAFVVVGIAYLSAAMAPAFVRSFRDMDRQVPAAPTHATT